MAVEQVESFLLHPDGTVLQAAPFKNNLYWAPQQPLGAGSYGTVFRCWERSGQMLTPVAVKQTKRGRTAREAKGRSALAKQEWTYLRRLQGVRGVVQLQGQGQRPSPPMTVDRQAYTILEFLPGCTLQDAVKAKAQQPYDCLWQKRLAQQLCTIISNIHERGVAWRDAQPHNIMCTAGHDTCDPCIAAVDFGLSLLMANGSTVSLKSADELKGTPEYMPPELLHAWDEEHRGFGVSYNAVAADAWSFGSILYKAATGRVLVDVLENPARVVGKWTPQDLEYLLQCHAKLQENDMAEKWAQLAERTGETEHAAGNTLECFLTPLLNPNPAERPTLSTMLSHPYLQNLGPVSAPLAAEPVRMLEPLPGMPSAQPPAPLLPEMGSWGELEAVPDMGPVFWRPTSLPVFCKVAGTVFRAWALTDNKSWQTCLLKRICLYEFEQSSHSTAGPAPPNKHLPSSATWCKSRQIKKQAAKAHKWALHNADLISLDTKALRDLQGAAFIPDGQFSFSSNVHFTLYRLPAGEVKTLQQEMPDRLHDSQPIHKAGFREMTTKLLQMLDTLHSKGLFLGALQPDRIVVQPRFYLMDCCPGDWLESVCSMQRLAPEAMEGISRGVYDKQQASSAAADVWSLGVLLYELGTGKAPFPGALQSGRPLRPDSELNAEEKLEFFDNVLQRLFMYQDKAFKSNEMMAELAENVGMEYAAVIMQMLSPLPAWRPTPSQVLLHISQLVVQPEQAEPTAAAVSPEKSSAGQLHAHPPAIKSPDQLQVPTAVPATDVHTFGQIPAVKVDQLPSIAERQGSWSGAVKAVEPAAQLAGDTGVVTQAAAMNKAALQSGGSIPAWGMHAKPSLAQDGAAKVVLTAQPSQVDVRLLHKSRGGKESVEDTQEPSAEDNAQRATHTRKGLKGRLRGWLNKRVAACKDLASGPLKCCGSKGLRVSDS